MCTTKIVALFSGNMWKLKPGRFQIICAFHNSFSKLMQFIQTLFITWHSIYLFTNVQLNCVVVFICPILKRNSGLKNNAFIISKISLLIEYINDINFKMDHTCSVCLFVRCFCATISITLYHTIEHYCQECRFNFLWVYHRW